MTDRTAETKSRPILFSGPMVRAILVGNKTQTRRVVKPQPLGLWGSTDLHTHTFVGITNTPKGAAEHPKDHCWNCPYGKPGGLLWVRETWAKYGDQIEYRASPICGGNPDGGWRPSIFMPRWASRITLRITDVRIERLTEITEHDAVAEGIAYDMRRDPLGPCKWASVTDVSRGWSSPVAAYQELWEDINGDGSWETNPWVWVISFERSADDVRAAA